MRFIGNKRNLLDDIEKFARKHIPPAHLEQGDFLDLFGGTNSVANHFKQFMPVTTNDSMYFSYVLAQGTTALNVIPNFKPLLDNLGTSDVLGYLNNINESDLSEGFITSNYTLKYSERNYMSIVNGMRVDHIRSIIDTWLNNGLIDKAGYYYLLSSLLSAISDISNTKGSYSAFLATVDNRTLQDLELKHPILIDNGCHNPSYNSEATLLLASTPSTICYIDPPYGTQQYTSNYHLLETICLNDNPDIKGKTGVRDCPKSEKSKFCSKTYASQAIFDVIEACQSPHIIFSYTSRGIVDISIIKQALARFCAPESIVIHKYQYHTYKGAVIERDDGHCEYLIYANKPNKGLNLGNTNNIDLRASYNLASDPQLLITPAVKSIDAHSFVLSEVLDMMPSTIGTFIDAFSGGMPVSANVECKELLINDINKPLIELLDFISKTDIGFIIKGVREIIYKYDLSRINEKGFAKLRSDYNKKPTPIALYTLICHSYDQRLRFNLRKKFNSSFGKDRSFFSETMIRNLILFNKHMQSKNISFSSTNLDLLLEKVDLDSDSLVYVNPPSRLIAKHSESGSRAFSAWSNKLELKLHEQLNRLDLNGYKFMLLDVYVHKDVINMNLERLSDRYTKQPISTTSDENKYIVIRNF